MRLSPFSIIVVLLACAVLPGRVLAQAVDPWAGERDAAIAASSETAPGTEILPDEDAVVDAVDPTAITGAVPRVTPAATVDAVDAETDVFSAPLRRTSPEVDPYEPLGIRAGSFILYPSLETTLGYTTNGANAAGGSESAYATIAPELRMVSDWARHEATLTLRGSYREFTDGSVDDQPTALIDGTVRLDLAEEWVADFSAGYDYYVQSFSDPDFPAGVDKPPGVHDFAGSGTLRGRFGRNFLEVGTAVDRTIYEDGTSGGVEVDQGDRNNTVVGGRLRYGYAVTPLVTPFVEGAVARRHYDRKFDDNGIERSSWNYAIRGGFAYRNDPVLSGEVAIGYAISELDDASLAALEALTFDGSLVWSPSELTTVTFNGATTLDPSTNPASSGSVVYDASVDIAYQWRRNITIGGLAGVQYDRFEGAGADETTYRLGLNTTWRINRTLHLIAGYLHEWTDSADPASEYSADSVYATVRLQR